MHCISHLKGLLWCHHDRKPPSRMLVRVLATTGSGNLIFGLPDFERTNFDLEAVRLFPDGVYEGGGKGAYRLGASVDYFSLWSPKLFLRTLRRGCDIIAFLYVLHALFLESCRPIFVGFLGCPYFAISERLGGEGVGLPVQEPWIDDCFREAFSDNKIFVVQYQGLVNGGRTGAYGHESTIFLSKDVNIEM